MKNRIFAAWALVAAAMAVIWSGPASAGLYTMSYTGTLIRSDNPTSVAFGGLPVNPGDPWSASFTYDSANGTYFHSPAADQLDQTPMSYTFTVDGKTLSFVNNTIGSVFAGQDPYVPYYIYGAESVEADYSAYDPVTGDLLNDTLLFGEADSASLQARIFSPFYDVLTPPGVLAPGVLQLAQFTYYDYSTDPSGVSLDYFELEIETVRISGVPEPLSLSILGAGIAGAFVMRRRKKV